MYECFHCLQRSVVWQADFSADEYGYDDPNGIIHVLMCATCGAEITYYIPGNIEEDTTDEAVGVEDAPADNESLNKEEVTNHG